MLVAGGSSGRVAEADGGRVRGRCGICVIPRARIGFLRSRRWDHPRAVMGRVKPRLTLVAFSSSPARARIQLGELDWICKRWSGLNSARANNIYYVIDYEIYPQGGYATSP